jgi:hypothetical protein
MKYLIACAGQQTRWNHYQNVPKQMVLVQDPPRPLLVHTIQQLQEHGSVPLNDIIVCVKTETVATEYHTGYEGIQYWATHHDNAEDTALITLAPIISHYHGQGIDVMVVLGDVLFSEQSWPQWLSHIQQHPHQFAVLGRTRGHENCPRLSGELFAYYLPAVTTLFYQDVIEMIQNMYETRRIDKKMGWQIVCLWFVIQQNRLPLTQVLKLMKQMYDERKFPPSQFVHLGVHDLTFDFDFPTDYDYYVTHQHRYLST